MATGAARTSPLAVRVGLVVLAVAVGEVGVWAAFFPRSFYAHFPGAGHVWVAVDGPYNQHLVRDVGQLELGLAVLFAVAAATGARPLVRAVLAVSVLPGTLHLAYHVAHIHDLHKTADKVGNVTSLALIVALPLALLAVDLAHDRSARRAITS
jgi:hypothetical protein